MSDGQLTNSNYLKRTSGLEASLMSDVACRAWIILPLEGLYSGMKSTYWQTAGGVFTRAEGAIFGIAIARLCGRHTGEAPLTLCSKLRCS